MNICFFLNGSMRATGCYYYLVNLLTVLSSQNRTHISILLFHGDDVDKSILDPFQYISSVTTISTPLLNKARTLQSLIRAIIFGCDQPLLRLISSWNGDILFEAASFYGWHLGLPVIGWIPDFQHIELPNHFNPVSRIKRDLGFRAQILTKRFIMLSSKHSFDVMRRHYGNKSEASVIPFALPPLSNLPSADDVKLVRDKYKLGPKYFFAPNQFWKHKNHFTLIKALRIVINKGYHIKIMACGKQEDNRNPLYFETISKSVHALNLNDDFIMPGLIPRSEFLPLLCGSMALINPSLYEGWSTPVEEAKSLGVPVLLSDIPVHMEQQYDNFSYFSSLDAISLADLMIKFLDHPSPSFLGSKKSAHDAHQRTTLFAENFIKFASSALFD